MWRGVMDGQSIVRRRSTKGYLDINRRCATSAISSHVSDGVRRRSWILADMVVFCPLFQTTLLVNGTYGFALDISKQTKHRTLLSRFVLSCTRHDMAVDQLPRYNQQRKNRNRTPFELSLLVVWAGRHHHHPFSLLGRLPPPPMVFCISYLHPFLTGAASSACKL